MLSERTVPLVIVMAVILLLAAVFVVAKYVVPGVVPLEASAQSAHPVAPADSGAELPTPAPEPVGPEAPPSSESQG